MKGSYTAKIILKRNKFKGHTFPNFEAYYQATVINTVWDRQRDQHID